MKVLWLSHNVPYPPIGGVLQRNYHLVHQVARRAELHLVALRQRALCPDDATLEEAREVLGGFCASVQFFPLDWDERPHVRPLRAVPVIAGRRPYIAARYDSVACHRALAQLAPQSFDLVHLDTIGLIPYWRHLRGPAAVLNHHNAESTMLVRRAAGEARPQMRAVLRWQANAVRRWERDYCPQFAANLVVSALDGERIREIAPTARTTVVANGVDTTYFDLPPNTEPTARGIVLLGSQAWYPNRDAVEYFLDDIWPKILAEEPKAVCTIIGQDPCPRALAADRDDPQVRVLGFVEDLRAELAQAAVFACPFRQGGGTRLKVLDAMAMRKAMVTTTIGAEGVPLQDGKHCLIADGAAAFAAAVVDLIRHPERRAQLGHNGRALVEAQYDWNAIGERLIQAYRDALPSAAGTRGNGHAPAALEARPRALKGSDA